MATTFDPEIQGDGTRGIVEAIGANFRPSPSRYARSSLMTFGRSDMNVPAVSAEVPTSTRGRALVALAIVVGALLLLR
ncbi:MAG TPA: hypothetical protein VEK85_17185 [Gemmatimonadales bacterium]|nr:hypothetical protein [Gemmatimonadales bacterium]